MSYLNYSKQRPSSPVRNRNSKLGTTIIQVQARPQSPMKERNVNLTNIREYVFLDTMITHDTRHCKVIQKYFRMQRVIFKLYDLFIADLKRKFKLFQKLANIAKSYKKIQQKYQYKIKKQYFVQLIKGYKLQVKIKAADFKAMCRFLRFYYKKILYVYSKRVHLIRLGYYFSIQYNLRFVSRFYKFMQYKVSFRRNFIQQTQAESSIIDYKLLLEQSHKNFQMSYLITNYELYVRQKVQQLEILKYKISFISLITPTYTLLINAYQFKIFKRKAMKVFFKEVFHQSFDDWHQQSIGRYMRLRYNFIKWRKYIQVETDKDKLADDFHSILRKSISLLKFKVNLRTNIDLKLVSSIFATQRSTFLELFIRTCYQLLEKEIIWLNFKLVKTTHIIYNSNNLIDQDIDQRPYYKQTFKGTVFRSYNEEFCIKFKMFQSLKNNKYRRVAFLRSGLIIHTIFNIGRLKSAIKCWKLFITDKKQIQNKQGTTKVQDFSMFKISFLDYIYQEQLQKLAYNLSHTGNRLAIMLELIQNYPQILEKYLRIILSLNLSVLQSTWRSIYNNEKIECYYEIQYFWCQIIQYKHYSLNKLMISKQIAKSNIDQDMKFLKRIQNVQGIILNTDSRAFMNLIISLRKIYNLKQVEIEPVFKLNIRKMPDSFRNNKNYVNIPTLKIIQFRKNYQKYDYYVINNLISPFIGYQSIFNQLQNQNPDNIQIKQDQTKQNRICLYDSDQQQSCITYIFAQFISETQQHLHLQPQHIQNNIKYLTKCSTKSSLLANQKILSQKEQDNIQNYVQCNLFNSTSNKLSEEDKKATNSEILNACAQLKLKFGKIKESNFVEVITQAKSRMKIYDHELNKLYKNFKDLEADKQFQLIDLFIYDQQYLLNSYQKINVAKSIYNEDKFISQKNMQIIDYKAKNYKFDENQTELNEINLKNTNTKGQRQIKFQKQTINEKIQNDFDDEVQDEFTKSIKQINITKKQKKNKLKIQPTQQIKIQKKKILTDADLVDLFHIKEIEKEIPQQTDNISQKFNQTSQKNQSTNNQNSNILQTESIISNNQKQPGDTEISLIDKIPVEQVNFDLNVDLHQPLMEKLKGFKGKYKKSKQVKNIVVDFLGSVSQKQQLFSAQDSFNNSKQNKFNSVNEKDSQQQVSELQCQEDLSPIQINDQKLSDFQISSESQSDSELIFQGIQQNMKDFTVPQQILQQQLLDKEFSQFAQHIVQTKDLIQNAGFVIKDQFYKDSSQLNLQSARIYDLYSNNVKKVEEIQELESFKQKEQALKMKSDSYSKLQAITFQPQSARSKKIQQAELENKLQQENIIKAQKRQQIVINTIKFQKQKYHEKIISERIQNNNQTQNELKIHIISKLLLRTANNEINDVLKNKNNHVQQVAKRQIYTQKLIEFNVTQKPNQPKQKNFVPQVKHNNMRNFNISQAMKRLSGQQIIEIFRRYRWKKNQFTPVIQKQLYSKDLEKQILSYKKKVSINFIFSNIKCSEDQRFNIISYVKQGKMIYQKQNIQYTQKAEPVDIDQIMILYADAKQTKQFKLLKCKNLKGLSATTQGVEVKQKINYDLLRNRPTSQQKLRK